MCGVRSIGLFLVMSAGFASVGCEAARAPAAPSEAAELSSPAVVTGVPTSGVVPVAIARGSLDIASRYDAKLSVGSHDPARLSWRGQLYDGWTPFDRMTVGVPGATEPVDAMWIGLALNSTTLRWGKTTYAHIGGLTSNSGGVLHAVGSVTLPPYTGQTTAKATGTFTISPAEYPSVFTAHDPQAPQALELRLTGTGIATMFLEWVPGALPNLPDGYWHLSRVVYRFD